MYKNHGKFAWYDLMTTDPQAAAAFYCHVLNWTAADSGIPGPPYTIFSHTGSHIAGMLLIPKELANTPAAHPHWTGHIEVDDVDATIQRIQSASGTLLFPAQDIPNVCRFAVLADPQGAAFHIFRGTKDTDPPVAPTAPGFVGWNELLSTDPNKAFDFYAQIFHWTKASAVDMGPKGIYQLFNIHNTPAGGMMTKPPEIPSPSFWLFYFNVDSLDAALARVQSAGGKLCFGPHEVAGPMFIANCLDPQGALFALVAPQR